MRHSSVVGPRAASGLPPEVRPLRTPGEFRHVLSAGRRIRKAGLTLVIAESQLPYPRLGMITPRRLGGAVVRNRIKRRIRAAARECGWEPADYVVIPTPLVERAPFGTVVRWLDPGDGGGR